VTVLSDLLTFLRGKGLTAAQAAGVAGNVQIESGLNPSAYNAKEGAIGFAQWEGPRRTALRDFAAALGKSETDASAQLQFMWHELNGSESGALAALRATTTPAEAAAVFDQKYERSSGGARKARIDAANAIASGATTGGDFAGVSTSSDATVTQTGWANDAKNIGLKMLGGAAAAGLVIVGAVHTVSSK
jgi:hypothetical protein